MILLTKIVSQNLAKVRVRLIFGYNRISHIFGPKSGCVLYLGASYIRKNTVLFAIHYHYFNLNSTLCFFTFFSGSSGFQAGIFKFHVNEEIFIRQASASGCPVIFEADRTYLGGYLLKHI